MSSPERIPAINRINAIRASHETAADRQKPPVDELTKIEAKLAAIEPVLKVKAGMASASVVFEHLRVPEEREEALHDVQAKLKEFSASLDAFLGDDYEKLLDGQRKYRQLIEQARLDGSAQ